MMKVKIFYGWYMVAATVVLSGLIAGVTFYGFTAFINPLAATFGWSYAQISLAMSIRMAESGVLDPIAGRLADRYPAKWLILIGVIIIGLGYLFMSQVNNLAQFYISFMIVALGGVFGSSLAPTVAVARWFRRNLGKASGLMALGTGFGGMLTPIVVKLIDAYGWRISIIILAIVMCAVGIPLAFVFRSKPQDYGMIPDGKLPSSAKEQARVETYDLGLGVRQVLKTRIFWQFGLASVLQLAGIGATILHVVPYLTSVGIDRSFAATVAMFIPMVSLGTRFAFGWLADIFPKKYVYAVSLALTSIGLFFLSFVNASSPALVVLFVIFFGLGLGGIIPIRVPLVREYFGMKNFGTIFGLLAAFMTIGNTVAPPIVGWVFDLRGVYDPIWLILAMVEMVGVVVMLTLPSPPRPHHG